MQVVREENGKIFTIKAVERPVFSGLAMKVLKSLASGEKYPKEIARELKVNEQKIYYHVRQLERKGYIKVSRKEERGGALAKIYSLASPSFVFRLGDFQEARKLPQEGFEPFVKNGMLEAKIIIGSPDPHGPERARSRDVGFAVDFALFLGTFLNKAERTAVIEDKDVHSHDLSGNLIIIGGPITNKVTKMVNDKLPVRFDKNRNIVAGRKTYRHDECGFIARAENPFQKGKKIIVIAGKRYSGTKAAVLAFLQHFDEIKNKEYAIVEGLDEDGDGEVDSVRIME